MLWQEVSAAGSTMPQAGSSLFPAACSPGAAPQHTRNGLRVRGAVLAAAAAPTRPQPFPRAAWLLSHRMRVTCLGCDRRMTPGQNGGWEQLPSLGESSFSLQPALRPVPSPARGREAARQGQNGSAAALAACPSGPDCWGRSEQGTASPHRCAAQPELPESSGRAPAWVCACCWGESLPGMQHAQLETTALSASAPNFGSKISTQQLALTLCRWKDVGRTQALDPDLHYLPVCIFLHHTSFFTFPRCSFCRCICFVLAVLLWV